MSCQTIYLARHVYNGDCQIYTDAAAPSGFFLEMRPSPHNFAIGNKFKFYEETKYLKDRAVDGGSVPDSDAGCMLSGLSFPKYDFDNNENERTRIPDPRRAPGENSLTIEKDGRDLTVFFPDYARVMVGHGNLVEYEEFTTPDSPTSRNT